MPRSNGKAALSPLPNPKDADVGQPNPARPDMGVLDDQQISAIQRRTLWVVVLAQILGGAGLAAGITVGALLAQDMLGDESLTGIPTALFTLGAALAAFLVGQVAQRRGRRLGLALGFFVGGVGAVGVVLAAAIDSIPLLFVSLFIYGSGAATNMQVRYAGTDLAKPDKRGSAISISLVSSTLGAVAGPNLVEPLGALAQSLGLPLLAGPFLLAAVAFILAGAVFFVLLRPDPFLVAKQLKESGIVILNEGESQIDGAESDGANSDGSLYNPAIIGVYVGASIMIVTQIAMVAIMTMTPIHMTAHHQTLSAVGLVIGLHVAAMFLPSPLTGYLVDRVGRVPVAIASAVTLLAAGLMAALAPGNSMFWLTFALILLGLGWNFGLISGTTMVVDSTEPDERPKVQGNIDVFVALAGAGGGAMSAVVMSSTSYSILSLAGGLLSLLLIPVLLFAKVRNQSANSN